MDGFLNILKPPGMTSSDVVTTVKRMLPRGTRVGHGGTLDPEAAGVLPVCVGKGARLFDYMIDKEKEYLAELALGVETDTQDATGAIVAERPVCVSAAAVRAALNGFVGDILQTPPAYSALKRGGKKLCDLARQGETVAIEPRPAHIGAIRYAGESGENRHMLHVVCGKGVYIRTLCHDIGRSLGCGAHMSFLLRTRSGVFALDEAVSLAELADIPARLYPLDAPIGYMEAVVAPENCLPAIRNGNPLPVGLFARVPTSGVPLRVYCAGRFAGVGECVPGGAVRFRAMLL